MVKWNYRMNMKKQTGFTIVELLIVIVVIGILAAITIVAFNGIQNRTHDTAVKNDLSNVAKKIEMFKVTDASNNYPLTGQLDALQFTATKGSYALAPTTTYNLVYCVNSTTRQQYGVVSMSKSGNMFYISHNSGGIQTLPSWGVNSGEACAATGLSGTNNWRGYAAEDSPVWRTWAGN